MPRRPSPNTGEPTLDRLYFGKDDAESDIAAGGLLAQGFLRTAAYEAALEGRKALIIGRKGSGKSAICLKLQAASDDHHRACTITPDEISADELRKFELPGIAREQSKALIWRYVFGVQAAKHLLAEYRERHGRETPPEELLALRKFLVDNGEVDDLRLHEKFWRVIERLKGSVSLKAFGAEVSAEASAPSDGIRASSQLDLLESSIRKATLAVPERPQLLLLVDQIEKVWSNDRNSDSMVVGLLIASKHVANQFPGVRCVVFLRSDIYDLLQFQDRDKFRGDEMHIDWSPEHLAELVLARARVSLGYDIQPAALWSQLFCEVVAGTPILDYLVQRTLMRPRDIIQLCNACRDTAQKNGHGTVQQADVSEAVRLYSNWKLSDLINEYRINYPFLGDLFVLFSNTNFFLKRDAVSQGFATIESALKTRYPEYSVVFSASAVLEILYNIGFLGVRRKGCTAYFFNDPNTIEVGEREIVIHPCFREALRSTSSVAVKPYSSALDGMAEYRYRMMSEFTHRRAGFLGTRGSRPFRFLKYLTEVGERLDGVIASSALPDEVRLDIRESFSNIRRDVDQVELLADVGDLDTVRRMATRITAFLVELRDGLLARGLIDKRLDSSLLAIANDLEKGLYSEFLE